jgi:hypothetical protein
MIESLNILDVKENEVGEFEVEDVFNGGNVLRGFICRRGDHRYGALVIRSVNGEPCMQLICATPKMHYPFNKNGDFNWPDIKEVQIWEKLDGTNILAYHYEYKGKDYVTYKTRLTPVVKDMKFGYFEAMWRELLDKQGWIVKAIEANPEYNLSFELYGERNPITIQYNIPLAAALLFGVRRSDYAIKPPTLLSRFDKSIQPRNYPVSSSVDMTSIYNELRAEMGIRNSDSLVDEGVVLYAHIGEPSWRQFKCKPEQIEKIHWANGGIPYNSLWTTALNAYESHDNPTLDDYLALLREEYSESQIQRCIIRVQKAHQEARRHVEFTATVNKAWVTAKENGFDVAQDKGATMRFLSQYFPKSEMRKVGTVILKQAGLI